MITDEKTLKQLKTWERNVLDFVKKDGKDLSVAMDKLSKLGLIGINVDLESREVTFIKHKNADNFYASL